MAMTNYPNGFSGGVSVRGVPVEIIPPNKVYFVQNTIGSDGNKGTKDKPFKTLDYAIGRCTASKGDIIFLLPGHAETISAAGGITCDVAGVTIIGLGYGSLRPTFTWSATASTWLVTAANVTIQNIVCLVSIDSVVKGIDISAAGCTLDAVDFQETSAKQMLIFINTAAGANYLTVKNCYHVQAAAGSAKWIDLVGADWARILNNHFHVSASTHILGGTTTESLEILVKGNTFLNTADAACVVLLANTTGFVVNNFAGGAKSAIAGNFALASAYGGENYSVNTANKCGILDPVADS
jgi:hypothetical protein